MSLLTAFPAMATVLVAMLLMTMLAGLAMLSGLGAGRTAAHMERDSLVRQLDALLPQTQCGRCTYTGCLPYARAIAHGEDDTSQCPPGGARTAAALARLMGREPKPVDPAFGVVPAIPFVAWIDESACIGCTKCIQACPVDAIVGASRYMHTVIAEHCTGCELCIPPCPVDCIEMRPPPALPRGTSS